MARPQTKVHSHRCPQPSKVYHAPRKDRHRDTSAPPGTTNVSRVICREVTTEGSFLTFELWTTVQSIGILITNTFLTNMAGGIWLTLKCQGRGEQSSFFRELSAISNHTRSLSKINTEALTVKGE